MDAMVRELALYERSPELVEATEQDLHRALFGQGGGGPRVHAHVAEVRTGAASPGGADDSVGDDGAERWAVVGMAVWYVTYSTWTGRHGMWLEDLYVRPGSRGLGIGRALLAALARVCTDRGYRRLEWWVLDWNTSAQGVYRAVGAVAQEEWTTWRLDGDALRGLGDSADLLPAEPPPLVDGPVDGPVDGLPDRSVEERIARPRSEPGPGAWAPAPGYGLAMDQAEGLAVPASAPTPGTTAARDASTGTGRAQDTEQSRDADGRGGVDRVELSVPADSAYLAVLRTATAGLAARADLTIDEIEDLRIAVDEACALVLGEQPPVPHGVDGSSAPPTPTIDAVFELGHQGMAVRVSGPSSALPERTSFAWSVLEALVDTLDAGTGEDGRRTITLRHGTRRRA